MLTRKQIAEMYGIHHQTVSRYLRKAGILLDNNLGKGNRKMITPLEFELFQKFYGNPMDVVGMFFPDKKIRNS